MTLRSGTASADTDAGDLFRAINFIPLESMHFRGGYPALAIVACMTESETVITCIKKAGILSKGGVERTVVRIASAAGAGCNLSKAIGEGLEGEFSCNTSHVTRHTSHTT